MPPQPASSSSNLLLNGLLNDDEESECPLCLEEFDVSEHGFKPCPCGYRICRFCWHNIRENLNNRCPACRKEYTDEAVEFTPMRPEELKRLQAAKKQKEREKKEGELNSRKHLANVRVKQRTQAHIQGMTARVANEDSIAHLKSPEVFGKYGKILKLFLAKRTAMPAEMSAAVQADPKNQPVNVYINYSAPWEASNCIVASDGAIVEGHRLRAGWGTTKYCPAYLRGQKCTQDNCMMAHEQGDEMDPVGGAPGPVTREEMSTLKHAMKEQESRDARGGHGRFGAGHGLPATASWAKMNQPAPPGSSLPAAPIPRPPTAPGATRLPKTTTHPLPARPPSREAVVAAAANAKTRQNSVQSMAGSATRRSSASSQATEDRNSFRRTSLIDPPVDYTSSPVADPPLPFASTSGPPPGLSRAAAPSPLPIASTSAAPISQHIVAPGGEAVYVENDEEEQLFGQTPGSFSFNLNIDRPLSTANNGKAKERPDIGWIDTSIPAADGTFGTDYLVSSSSASMASSVPVGLQRTASEEGYSGVFDPFAEMPGEGEPLARPKSSRFDFAKKGLFGSNESLSSLAMTGLPADQPLRAPMSNGRASPLSILTAGAALRSNSPKRAVISPPPGLKSASPANDPFWYNKSEGPLRTTSPGAELSGLARLSLTSAPPSSQSLPFSAHIPPSMGDLASRPLPAALSSAATPLPPPPKPAAPGFNRPPGHGDPYSHLLPGASAPLPPRTGSAQNNEHILSDPAILNMSTPQRYPGVAAPNMGYNHMDFGNYYGQQASQNYAFANR